MNLNKLAYVKQAKYLGVIVCNDMKDYDDILRHLRNFSARSNSIIRKFLHCSICVKLHMFYVYLDSASSMFVNTAIDKFDVLMRNNIYG